MNRAGSALAVPTAEAERSGAERRLWPGRLRHLGLGTHAGPVNLAGWTLFALMGALFVGQAFGGVLPQDEGVLLTYPWLIAHGAVPYRDVWMMYPPTTFLFLAAFAKVGLPGIAAERALGIAARLLYVLLVNRAYTGSWRRLSWLAAPVSFSLLFLSSDVRAYPWVVGLPALLAALLAVGKRPGLACSLFFLAGTIRLEFGVAGFAALGALSFLSRPDKRRLARFAASAAALAGLLLAFYGLLNLATGGEAVRDIVVEPASVISPLQRLPLVPPAYASLFLPVTVLLFAAPLATILLGLALRQPEVAATNCGTAVLLGHFLQRADSSHLFAAAAIVLPWAAISLSRLHSPSTSKVTGIGSEDWVGRTERRKRAARQAVEGMVGVVGGWCFLIVLAYGVYLSPLSPVSPQGLNRMGQRLVGSGSHVILAMDGEEARQDRQVLTYLHRRAGPRDRLFIVPDSVRYVAYTMTDLYFAAGLRPASRYLELSGVERQPAVQREIVSDLRACRWILLVRAGDWYAPAARPSGSSLLERSLRERYRPVYQDAWYQILLRRASR